MQCQHKIILSLYGGPKLHFFRLKWLNNCVFQCNWIQYFSSSTDSLIDNLVIEAGSKRELSLSKYFINNKNNTLISTKEPLPSQVDNIYPERKFKHNHDNNNVNTKSCGASNIDNVVEFLEKEMGGNGKVKVPNDTLQYLLVYYAKKGNLIGVKAIQIVIKKYNLQYFINQSEFNHYIAEALWMNGKVEESLKLFMTTYENPEIRGKVQQMLVCLFPSLTTHHSPAILKRTVYLIQTLFLKNDDCVLLACLWKELFQSEWFSDQQLAKQILQQNVRLLQVIQWMITSMGKDFLRCNRVDDFYRLVELTLENNLKKHEGMLLRMLFDHYYSHRNMKGCSEVIKYSSNGECPLTEEQQVRYVKLLLKRKNFISHGTTIKKPSTVEYKF